MGQAIPLSIQERIVKLRKEGKKFTTHSQFAAGQPAPYRIVDSTIRDNYFVDLDNDGDLDVFTRDIARKASAVHCITTRRLVF